MGFLLMKKGYVIGFHQDTPWTIVLQSEGTPGISRVFTNPI
jgi:hypothetical protein